MNYTKLNQNAVGSCISKFLAFESSLALGHVSVITGLSPLVRHSQRNALSPVSPAESQDRDQHLAPKLLPTINKKYKK